MEHRSGIARLVTKTFNRKIRHPPRTLTEIKQLKTSNRGRSAPRSDVKKIISQLLKLQTLSLETPGHDSTDAKALREQIPAHILVRFDKFILRGKKGVALVQNGVCKGCQIQVPLNAVNSLIVGMEALTCGNCGRYLLLLDEDAVAFRDRNVAVITVPKRKAPKAPKLAAPAILPKSKKPRKAALATVEG